MNGFLSYMKKAAPQLAEKLTPLKPGSQGFNNVWKQIANMNPEGFETLQHNFIKSSHYDPVVKRASDLGLDVTKRSKAVQDAVWSTAVQHGVGGATSVLKNAIAGNPNMSDKQLIQRIYNERGANNGMKYFGSSSPEVRKSVVNRFKNEMNDALRMI